MLDNDWLTTDPIDFEYKKYMVLAYDQRLTKELEQQKIYPNLSDIVEKIKIVNEFLSNVQQFEQSKLGVTDIDWNKKEVVYQSHLIDPNFDEIKAIAKFSKSILVDLYDKYRRLLDDVDYSIVISGCKVDIFNMYDGYIVLKTGKRDKILYYEVVRLLYPKIHYVLKTSKVSEQEYYSDRLTKNVFDVIFKGNYPMKESTLPVYRRKFLENLFGFI